MTRNTTAFRVILLLGVLCAGLAATCVVLIVMARRDGGGLSGISPVERALEDDSVKKAAIAALVERGSGVWDLFPDPAVGRVLQPGLRDRELELARVSSNELGWREHSVALPKPAGTIRIALLGDSYVMGHNVAAKDRFGVFLEQFLNARSVGTHGLIECLHVGENAWNVVAETAYLRRQLSFLRPDLVVHVVVRNDLEDNVAVRGYGAMAYSSPLHPERGEAIFETRFPQKAFGTRLGNWLAHGLDWESRSRFEEAGRAISGLAAEVTEQGGRYLLLDYYTGLLPASRHFLASSLKPDEVAYLPTALIQDQQFRVSRDDAHWNRAGHELIAKLLYHLIQTDRLLPAVSLAPWPEADTLAKEWLEQGRAEADKPPDFDHVPEKRKISNAIDFAKLDDDAAAQVNGGIYSDGSVGPYASVLLRCGGASNLTIEGQAFDRCELDGVNVDLFVDEANVGSFALRRRTPIEFACALPESVRQRAFVSVRFVSSDYAYGGPDLRRSVVFALRRVALK